MKNLIPEIELSDREPLKVIWESKNQLQQASFFESIKEIFRSIFNGVIRSPLSCFLTLITSTASLLILISFVIVIENIEQTVISHSNNVSVSIYLKDGTTNDLIEKLYEEIKNVPSVSSAQILSKQGALKEFTKLVGADNPILVGLEDRNPLPQSIELFFTQTAIESGQYQRVMNEFSTIPYVESIKAHGGELSDVAQILSEIKRVATFGTIAIAVIVSLLIANALKLSIYAHQRELEIMDLVGASNWKMRISFVTEGGLIGLVSSIISLLCSKLLLSLISQDFFLNTFGSKLNFISAFECFCIVLLFTLIGAAASYLSTLSLKNILR